jgi:hypothetical protein
VAKQPLLLLAIDNTQRRLFTVDVTADECVRLPRSKTTSI